LSIASMPLTASPTMDMSVWRTRILRRPSRTALLSSTIRTLVTSGLPQGRALRRPSHQHKHKYGPRVGSVFAQLCAARLKSTKAARPSCASKQPPSVCHSRFSDR
jgi:hypothetical protein